MARRTLDPTNSRISSDAGRQARQQLSDRPGKARQFSRAIAVVTTVGDFSARESLRRRTSPRRHHESREWRGAANADRGCLELSVPGTHRPRATAAPGGSGQADPRHRMEGARTAVSALSGSDGTKPRYAMSWRGLAKRVISPSSATIVAAATRAIPRSACRARTTGASDQSGSAASISIASRRRRLFQHDVMRRHGAGGSRRVADGPDAGCELRPDERARDCGSPHEPDPEPRPPSARRPDATLPG